MLRRKSLQAFIEAIPSERYREVAAFLDIPQIEASEASLREALKDHKGQFDRAAAMTDQAREQSQGLWEVESQRKNYVEKVLAEITSAVDSLYQQIHPKEHIGGIQLKLDDKKRGSLLYGVVFGDETNVHPQPYYSESHLDTLGLCIFLALAKRAGVSCIVVLDDVLGSVDQQHLNRTLDMLLNETDRFGQIILTSHYRPLRDRFQFAHNASQKVQTLELKPWSISGGIRSAETLTYRDELKAKLVADNFEREVVPPAPHVPL